MEEMICYYDSPIGKIRIVGSIKGISKLVFVDEMSSNLNNAIDNQRIKNSVPSEMTSQWTKQLVEYFRGERTKFDLELDLQGTNFQKCVWEELLTIPYGKTVSYKELTLKRWDIKTIRAVAAANGANPVSILVPCHRVVGSNGSLTGYAGGIWRKRWLLDFEHGLTALSF